MKRAALLTSISTVVSLALSGRPVLGPGRDRGKGKPKAEIVVAPDAGPTEKYAAEELGFFLQFMVGAPIPVVGRLCGFGCLRTFGSVSIPSGRRAASYRLLVGEGAVRLAEPDFRAASLKT